jgi:flagellar biogenesis protein FliO
MKRTLVASVIVMTLSVTGTSLADSTAPATSSTTAAPAVAPPVASAPSAPSAAAPAHSAAAHAASASPVATPAASAAPPAPAVTTAAPAPKPAPAPTAMAQAATPASAALATAPAPAAAPPPATSASAAPATAPAPASSSELPLRAPQPLTLAPEPSGTSWGYKLLFVAAIAVAGFLAYRKRRARAAEDRRTAVKVIGKTSMGLRGELALVEVGGMRLLVGVTPSSMQTLAVLPDDVDVASEPGATTDERPAEPAPRVRSLLAELEGAVSRTSSKTPPAAFSASRYEKARKHADEDDAPESAPQPPRERRRPAREGGIEGQARGIALALRGTK